MQSSDILDAINSDRLWRVKELSNLRQVHLSAQSDGQRDAISRSVVVICYAHWEGFCAFLVNLIIDKLEADRIKFSKLPYSMRLGIVSSKVQSFLDKSDTTEHRVQLIRDLGYLSAKPIVNFDRKILLPRSNLNYKRLEQIYAIIEADLAPFQTYRIKLNKEIVGWRHSVAHGEMFLLNESDVTLHTDLCEKLLFALKETFEDWIWEYAIH